MYTVSCASMDAHMRYNQRDRALGLLLVRPSYVSGCVSQTPLCCRRTPLCCHSLLLLSRVNLVSHLSSLSLFSRSFSSHRWRLVSSLCSLFSAVGHSIFDLPLSCSLSYSLVSSHLGALASVLRFLLLHHIIHCHFLRLPCACCSLTTLRLPSARQKLVGSRDHSSSLLSSALCCFSPLPLFSIVCTHSKVPPALRFSRRRSLGHVCRRRPCLRYSYASS